MHYYNDLAHASQGLIILLGIAMLGKHNIDNKVNIVDKIIVSILPVLSNRTMRDIFKHFVKFESILGITLGICEYGT